MQVTEREQKILDFLKIKKSITIKDLEKELFVSSPTIRRDLNNLSKKGLIIRTHGGAVGVEIPSNDKISFSLRECDHSDAKIIMAKKAISFINDGDVIFLDGTTSAYYIVPFLVNFKDITVITNSAKASIALGELGISNICTGGKMIMKSFTYVGQDACHTISNYNADIAFFSCKGLSSDGKLTSSSVEENELRQNMLKNSKYNVFLCDSTKFGKVYFHTLCKLSDIDEIISEKSIPHNLISLLKNK